MSGKTKAELEQELEEALEIIDNVKREVLGYDGCHQGKVEFLRDCGIEVNEKLIKAEIYIRVDTESAWGNPLIQDVLRDAGSMLENSFDGIATVTYKDVRIVDLDGSIDIDGTYFNGSPSYLNVAISEIAI